MPTIYLIGFMCSGKTTLGSAVSRKTGIPFVDLDTAIEQEAGMTVKEIFAQRGEQAFRELERDVLRRYATMQDVIVACGGGTPCQPGAMELMNDTGLTIWLQPSTERLINRLMSGRHKRPLIAAINDPAQMGAFADAKIAERAPYYSQAQQIFDTSMLETPLEIAVSVDEFVRRFVNS